MRGGAAVALAWGVLLAALGTVQLGFHPAATTLALSGGAAAAMVALGTALAVIDRGVRSRQTAGAELRVVADRSPAVTLVATGLAVLVGGATAGAWLSAIGALVLLLGLAGLVREARARRRAAAAVQRRR